MIKMNIYVLTVFVVFVSVTASSKCVNPCKDVKDGDADYIKEDPLDCTKYFECHGKIPHRKDCPGGTSFDPENGGCIGEDDFWIGDCKSGEGTLGQWSEWSECSIFSDQGKHQRQRECTGPGDCVGHCEDERDCPDLPSCKGAPGQWSDWSEYSATCEGLRRRAWKCIGPGDCEGLVIDKEEEICPDHSISKLI